MAKGSGRGRGAEGCRESGQRGDGGLTPGCRLTCRENIAPSRGPFMARERGRRSGCGARLRALAEAGGGQDTRGGVCSRAGRDGAGRGSRPRGSKLEAGSRASTAEPQPRSAPSNNSCPELPPLGWRPAVGLGSPRHPLDALPQHSCLSFPVWMRGQPLSSTHEVLPCCSAPSC